MKLILPFLLLTLSIQAQTYKYDPVNGNWIEDSTTWHKPREVINHNISISAGINYSKFVGSANFYGPAKIGFAGGISDKIKLNGNWFIQPSLSYESKGAYNQNEAWNFNTYSLVVDGFIGYNIGSISLMAAPYYERVIYAANYRFIGDGFGWNGGSWRFWNRNQIGLTFAGEIDFKGASLHLEYSHGISQVRGELKDHTGMANYTLWHNRNSVIGCRLVIHFKTFTE